MAALALPLIYFKTFRSPIKFFKTLHSPFNFALISEFLKVANLHTTINYVLAVDCFLEQFVINILEII